VRHDLPAPGDQHRAGLGADNKQGLGLAPG
jgi:hypothetical protein